MVHLSPVPANGLLESCQADFASRKDSSLLHNFKDVLPQDVDSATEDLARMRQTGSDVSAQSERSRLSGYAGAHVEPPHIDLPADGENPTPGTHSSAGIPHFTRPSSLLRPCAGLKQAA